jgi:NADH:ubiquinone oxidoreductase subunit E
MGLAIIPLRFSRRIIKQSPIKSRQFSRRKFMQQSPAEQVCPPESETVLMERLDEVLEKYRKIPGALIPVLQIAQGLFGYLPSEVIRRVSRGLNLSLSEVAGVVTFYSFFSTNPRGKHVIRVCLGTACYVRGGTRVLEAIKKKLGIDVGGTTPDRMFSLEVGRCFGACGLAPVIMVDQDVHHRVNPNKLDVIFNHYRDQEAILVKTR